MATWHSYRSNHRKASHQQQHDDAAEAPPPVVLDDPLVSTDEAAWVDDDAGLAALIDELRAAGCFAYDAEFIGEHSYEPRFCVLQAATADRVALIDALAHLDLTPFWELLTDPGVRKLVHAGRQDLEPAVRHLDRAPANVFDVQLAAGFIGLDYPLALRKLAQALVDADLGAGLKFSQWDVRPLTAVQKQYAANDVRYLPLIDDRLVSRLEATGNLDFAQAACDELCDIELYRFDAQQQSGRIRGAGTLNPVQRRRLTALVDWRDGLARQQDVPPRTLLKDGVLLELSRKPVRTAEDFRTRRGIPKPIKQVHAQTVIGLSKIDAPTHDSDSDKPMPGRLTHAQERLVDELLDMVRRQCAAQRINPAVVTSKKQLTRLVRALTRGTDPNDTELLRGWRGELLDGSIRETMVQSPALGL